MAGEAEERKIFGPSASSLDPKEAIEALIKKRRDDAAEYREMAENSRRSAVSSDERAAEREKAADDLQALLDAAAASRGDR